MTYGPDVVDLPEHLANPFTAKLGPPLSLAEKYKLLARMPTFHEGERTYPHHLRRYCALRLFEFVHPRSCQLELVERIGMLIRFGYKYRNPLLGQHQASILDAADRRDARSLDLVSPRGLISTACGMTLLGHPGMGKSLSVDLALSQYPRVIVHDFAYHVVQVPWLKIECPEVGGRKQFCIAFFQALGDRVGQNYRAQYAKERRGPDEMVLDVQSLCQVHAVGVIVIDELQHALRNVEGPQPLMDFLVRLTNIVGVPILPVGTMAASKIVDETLRSARRAVGLGQPNWERLREGADWDRLVRELWKFQWTDQPTPFSTEIGKELYHQTQGIIDLLVKLYMLCQFRAISIGEGRKSPEMLTVSLVQSVAAEEMKLVQPLVHAMRTNRADLIEKYSDLRPFHRYVDSVMAGATNMTMEELGRKREVDHQVEIARETRPNDPLNAIRGVLVARGMADDIIENVITEASRREPSLDQFATLRVVMELVEGKLPSKVKRPRRTAASTQASQAGTADSVMDPKDLRAVAFSAKERGVSVHAGFVEVGRSKSIADVIAACA